MSHRSNQSSVFSEDGLLQRARRVDKKTEIAKFKLQILNCNLEKGLSVVRGAR